MNDTPPSIDSLPNNVLVPVNSSRFLECAVLDLNDELKRVLEVTQHSVEKAHGADVAKWPSSVLEVHEVTKRATTVAFKNLERSLITLLQNSVAAEQHRQRDIQTRLSSALEGADSLMAPAELPADLKKQTVLALRRMCIERLLDGSGLKADLIARLEKWKASQ
jgi:hypothetical protein